MTTESAPKSNPDSLTNGVIPYFHVSPASEAVEFYKRAFGAREVSRTPTDDGKRLVNAQLEINGGLVMLMDPMPEHGAGFLARSRQHPERVATLADWLAERPEHLPEAVTA